MRELNFSPNTIRKQWELVNEWFGEWFGDLVVGK